MYLGIDIGTSGVKAILMDSAGEVVTQATSPLLVSRPKPLWSEQDPEEWWHATGEAVLKLPDKLRAQVQAVGLAGQMHGATILDKQDRPLRSAILWNDGRSALECAELEKRVPDLHSIAGNMAMPGFTAPKLVWLADNEPDLFDKTAKVLLPKDYVRLLLTGEYASDMSDAAGTLWMDVGKRDWSEDVLAACSLNRTHMPKLYEGTEITGEVLSSVASDWGIPAGVPVIAGGGDNAAGAVGVGIVKPGEAFLSLGTSGVLFVANEEYRPNAENAVHTFCHALPGLWHQMAVMLSAASCIDWGAGLTGAASAAEFVSFAERGEHTEADTPLFLPYLSGERTPHNDPKAKGVLFGMTHDTSKTHVAQSVLEGVALGFADGLDVLSGSSDINSITVIGGGSRSTYWGKILAAALAKPLTYRKNSDVGPALGAARLAQIGLGHLSVTDFTPPPIEQVIEADPMLVQKMAEKLPRYRALYHSTQEIL